MARRRALRRGVLLLALAAAVGCASLRERFAVEMVDRAVPLTFDRPSDLLPPEGLRITSTDGRAIALAWDPVLIGDVAGYAILRSPRESESYQLIDRTYSRFETVYSDRGVAPGSLGDGQTYYYRIHPYDSAGRVSRSHAFARATTEPAPEKPEGLQAYSSLPRRVVLSWSPSPRKSVTGYALLRSPTVAGPWEEVAFVRGRVHTIYEDPVPGDLRVMYYRLQALNEFGGRSDLSDPVRAVTKAEPLPPLAASARSRELGSIALGWPRNVEPDITAYEVRRAAWQTSTDGWGDEQVIGQVAAPATEFTDPEVGCGQRVRYRLRALDSDGLISAHSQPLEEVGQDIGLEAVAGDGGMELRWDPARAQVFEAARIVQRRRLLPDRLLGEVAGRSRFALSALGSGQHRLAVILEDRDPSDTPGAAGARRTAPPCELDVRLP